MLFLYGMHKRDKGRGQSRKNSAIIIKIIIPSRLWLLVYFSSDSPSLLDRHCQGLVRTSQDQSGAQAGVANTALLYHLLDRQTMLRTLRQSSIALMP